MSRENHIYEPDSFAKIKHKCPSALSPVFQKSGWIYLSKIHPLCFILFFLRNLDSARIHLMTVYGCIPCHDTGIRIQIIFLTILREPAGLHLTVVRQIIPFFSCPVLSQPLRCTSSEWSQSPQFPAFLFPSQHGSCQGLSHRAEKDSH